MTSAPEMNRESHVWRWVWILAIVAAAGFGLYGFWSSRSFYHDDAYITLRYAAQALRGEGFVWNPGERVEGYTNFLHLLLIFLLGKAGVNLVSASRLINGIAFLSLIGLFVHFSRGLGDNRPSSYMIKTVPLLLVMTSFPLIVWVNGGLEGPFFALWCGLGTVLALNAAREKGRPRLLVTSGVSLALACMTRPDGFLFVIVTVVFLAWQIPIKGNIPWRILLWFGGPFSLLYGPYFMWRYQYYQDLFPNTFYVKMTCRDERTLFQGVDYLMSYALSAPWLLLICLVLLVLYLRRTPLKGEILYLIGIALLQLAYVVVIGGDHMPGYRLMLPIIPVVILLISLVLAALNQWFSPAQRVSTMVLILVFVMLQPLFPRMNVPRKLTAAFTGEIVGRYIAHSWPEGSLIAVNTAGSTPYYALNMRFIDMLGLNDRHIAHRQIGEPSLPWQRLPGHLKGDGLYVLSRRPDYIIVGPSFGTTIDKPWFLSDLEMSRAPEFPENYIMEQVSLDVRQVPDHQFYEQCRTGTMLFTFYRRVGDPATGS